MPISLVRSFTVMIMMLLMPTMPAINVPRPTNQMNTLMPMNRPVTRFAGSAMLKELMPRLSSGATSCRRFSSSSTFFSSSKPSTPFAGRTQMLSVMLAAAVHLLAWSSAA